MTVWQRLVGGRPIVTRLVLAVAAAMAVVLVLAAAFVYWRVAYALNRQLDQDLAAWRSVVNRSVAEGQQTPLDTPGQTFQLYGASGDLVGGNQAIPRLASRAQVAEVLSGQDQEYDVGAFLPAPARAYRVTASTVEAPQGRWVVVAAISRRKHDEALRELLLQLAIADLIALGGASFVGYRTARAALDPVEAYRRAAERAGNEEVGRLPVAEDRDDELSRLGHTFNDLLARIESGAVRERQFLADASHELRTPLALISTELEWARHRPRSPEQMAQVLGSLREQVDRLVAMTNALLEVEELRASGPLPREEVRLGELVSDAVRDGLPLDGPPLDDLPPDLVLTVSQPDATVAVNRRWMTIAVANLLRNARRHGEGVITLEAACDGPRLRLVVRDQGPGFPAAFREVAFDRFTRADSSRTTPGSGLGLHLVRSVALAHGGQARVLDGPGGAVELIVDARR